MRDHVNGLLVLSVMVLVAIGAPLSGSAQEAADTSPDAGVELEAKGQELASAMEEKGQELDRLRELILSASGDDVTALRERALDLVTEYLVDVEGFSSNIVEREEMGLDVTDDRVVVSDTVDRTSKALQSSIEKTQQELRNLRSSKDGASAEEIEKIERDLALTNTWLDRTLDLYVDLTLTMEGFGSDASADREFLNGHLTDRAELVSGRIMLTRERLNKIEGRLENDPSNAEFNSEFDRVKVGLDRYVERLTITTRMMGDMELDTADYQQLLFQVTGEITTSLFSREVLGGLLKSWGRSVMDKLTHQGPTLVLRAFLFVLILFAFRVLSRIARRLVRKAIKTSSLQVSTLLERTALSVTGSLVMIFGLLVALSQLGFKVGPLLAGLGVAGFIVGFALQDTLSNFASGVMILLYRPYDVGDLIEAAGAFGTVKDMTLVSTTILTLDHQTLVIPNNKIWGDVIKNVTAQTNRRVDMVFGIGYADDIPHAERVLREIVEAHDKVLEDPEPKIKLHTLNESSVDFIVRPWVATDDYWDVYWDITREVKIRFDAEKISIPFPQRDVHVFQEGE